MRALHLLLETILILVTGLFVAELNQRFLERWLSQQGITYTYLGLTSPNCLHIQNLGYQNLPIADRIDLCWEYRALLEGMVVIDRLAIQKLDLNSIQELASKQKKKKSEKRAKTPPFLIKEAAIWAIYRYKGQNMAKLHATDISATRAIIKQLYIDSFAAKIRANGRYEHNLTLTGSIYPKPSYLKTRLPSQIDPTSIHRIDCNLTAGTTQLRYTLSTKANHIWQDLNASLHSRGHISYKPFRFHSTNHIQATIRKSRIESNTTVEYDKRLHFQGTALVKNGPYDLAIEPSFYKELWLRFQGTPKTIELHATNRLATLDATIVPHKEIVFATSKIPLASLYKLPERLRKSWIQIEGVYSDNLQATITSDLAYATLLYDRKRLAATIHPHDFYEFHLSALAPLTIKADLIQKRAKIKSPLLAGEVDYHTIPTATLKIKESRLDLRYEQNVSITAKIPSLRRFVQAVSTIYPIDLDLEAKIFAQATIDPLTKKYRLAITSPQTIKPYKLTYFDLKAHGDPKNIFIDYYAIAFLNHAFYATKRSHIRFVDGGIQIEPLWIEDKIRLVGRYVDGIGHFAVTAKDYRYSSIEGTATLDGQIALSLRQKHLNAEGHILLKGGTITLEPRKRKSVGDPDIIVVDAPKRKESNFFLDNVALNIKIDTQKPIRYEIPDLSVVLRPDLLIWKEYKKPLQLLGYIHILQGLYRPLGEEYKILPSDLYFYAKPDDPLLDLHIRTKKESYTIYITISGTLSNPILRFDSDPYLPQKDILTLLLMGSKSSSLLFKATGGDRLVGALGNIFVKNLLSTIGIELDTLTLTADGGRLGFEIGKRLGKKIVVVYKNDVVSTIIIRYEISDHIESEVIFGPQRSGINLFYRNRR